MLILVYVWQCNRVNHQMNKLTMNNTSLNTHTLKMAVPKKYITSPKPGRSLGRLTQCYSSYRELHQLLVLGQLLNDSFPEVIGGSSPPFHLYMSTSCIFRPVFPTCVSNLQVCNAWYLPIPFRYHLWAKRPCCFKFL